MFSERLEKLIQSSLQDGILTDQEKAAILKRAKAEGEDVDEIEIYIDSLLQKRKKELNHSVVIKRANTSSTDDLKKLIDAAMADGVITSKEREVIIRKAAAFGIDAAEVEVYLDAEIQKAEQAADAAKQDKIGKVCPKCGAQVPPLTLKCDCGYEFTTQKKVSSIELLSEKIQEVLSKSARGKEEENNKNQEIINMITMFPVPNSKEDIVEFLSVAIANSKKKGGLWGTTIGRFVLLAILSVIGFILGLIFTPSYSNTSGACIGALVSFSIFVYGGMAFSFVDQETIRYNKRADAWRAKFQQVMIKGRSLRGDAEFTRQLDYYENLLKK